jgi:hypothetical protein
MIINMTEKPVFYTDIYIVYMCFTQIFILFISVALKPSVPTLRMDPLIGHDI